WTSPSREVIIGVDGLSTGVYNFTIVASDAYGHLSSDSVWVMVFEFITTPTPTITTTRTNNDTTLSDFDFIRTVTLVTLSFAGVVVISVIVKACQGKKTKEWEELMNDL
ncbi:MAG: hypothetical protein ACW97O_16935, partial [Candidatus Thorarchaeota archaeon]